MNERGENMKAAKIKGIIIGIVLTLVVEAGIFMYKTCNVQVTTKYTYNPTTIVEMIPQGSELVSVR